jgi:hypothetical protein
MANRIPSGSKNTKEFVSRLDAANHELLKRALRFADDLNANIIGATKPRLMIVLLSFGSEPRLDKIQPVGVSMTQTNDWRERNVTTDREPFRFFVATYRRGAVMVPESTGGLETFWKRLDGQPGAAPTEPSLARPPRP